MAKDPEYIDSKVADVSMDYTALLELGLEYIISYSSEEWTNYNESDPGITFLETLCYALTDLGYRTDFSIPDILTTKQDEQINAGENAFYTPSQIFPINPVTVDDYRKFLLSNIPELQNVWVTPLAANKEYGCINGLYDILLQLDKSLHAEKVKKIIKRVKEHLNKHRNLCEDYHSIKAVEHQEVKLEAKVYIEANADPNEVKVEVIEAVNSFFSQIVPRYSRKELLAEGWTPPQIYEGALQPHGFIKTEELYSLRELIYVGEITQLIHEVEGVTKVESVNLYDSTSGKNHIDPYPTNRKILYLSPNEEEITIIQNNNNNTRDTSSVVSSPINDFIRNYAIAQETPPEEIPQGHYRNIEHYYSFQRELPHIYHVGDDKLGDDASDLRKAQAKQLKAYLLFFDQFLADYLSQLSHTKQLFSIDHDISQTYFYQIPENVPRLEEVVVSNFKERLKEIMEHQDPFFHRRDQFARHLLARFAERLPVETIDILHDKTENSSSHRREQFLQNKIRLELDFLQKYIDLSRNRGKAYDYLNVSYGNRDWSGLHHRLNLFLDYPDIPFYIIENILLRPSNLQQSYAFFTLSDKAGHALLENYGFLSSTEMGQLLKRLPEITYQTENFQIYKWPGKKVYLPYHIYLYDGEQNEQVVAQYPLRFAKEEEAEEMLIQLQKTFSEPWGNRFTIEKNKVPANYFSNRLTIVVPEASHESTSENDCKSIFGDVFNNLVKGNTPSHLAVCYRFINDRDTNLFLEYYNAWLLCKEGRVTHLNPMHIDDAASRLIKFLLLDKCYRSCIEIIPDESFFYS